MPTITPFLWFDTQAREAAEFYVSVFGGDSKIRSTQLMHDTPSGTVEILDITLCGRDFTLMSAGPVFKFNEAISFVIDCKDQEEVDYFWEKLSAHKEAEQCGWLKDKFGVSWQVTPVRYYELMQDPDPERVKRVVQAMLQMKKLDVAALEAAANG